MCRRLRKKSDCLPVVTNDCKKSPVRVIKSVRLSLDIVRPLLQRDPALKLIHLFRDPRGIIYSRLVKTRWYPLNIKKGNFTPIERHVRLLCNRMFEDAKAGRQLMDLFPNRVKLIRYEDILSYTMNEHIHQLKQFLDMSFNEKRVKTNVRSLNEWVAKLDKKVVEIVDSHCSRVYDNLGYIKLDDIKHVKEDRKSFLPFIPALTMSRVM